MVAANDLRGFRHWNCYGSATCAAPLLPRGCTLRIDLDSRANATERRCVEPLRSAAHRRGGYHIGFNRDGGGLGEVEQIVDKCHALQSLLNEGPQSAARVE